MRFGHHGEPGVCSVSVFLNVTAEPAILAWRLIEFPFHADEHQKVDQVESIHPWMDEIVELGPRFWP